MKAIKWNYETHDYDEYELPEGSINYSDDMDKVCSCAACGAEMVFGDSYTSLEIHTPKLGFGYCVCEKCHEEEWVRRKAEEKL